MLSANLAHVIAAATDERQDDPFALAVRGAVEVGVVVPSILRRNLEAAGFTIVEDEAGLSALGFAGTRVLVRTVVTRDGDIVAMGAASDASEAILHAALGWFREHPLPDLEAPAGVAVLTPEG